MTRFRVSSPASYSDNPSIITAAITTVSMYIAEDFKRQASLKLQDWFGA